MRKHRLAAFTLFVSFAGGAPAAEKTANQQVAVSRAPVVKVRPQVPQFPADVKARGDRLWNAASSAVKAWAKQIAPSIANGAGDPEAMARAAVQARWPGLRVAGAADTLTFLVTYEAAKDLQAILKNDLDSKSEPGTTTEQLRVQQTLERNIKAWSMLSNMLKKWSETSDGIIANLK
jgi:hypothetical protein